MTYDAYRYLFFGALALAIIMLIVTVVAFFLMDIRGVIGNLSGSTAKKAIEDIKSGAKTKKKEKVLPSKTRGEDTAKISLQDRYDSMGASGGLAHGQVVTPPLPKPAPAPVPQAPKTGIHTESFADVSRAWVVPSNVSGFVVEMDITYTHSDEVVVNR